MSSTDRRLRATPLLLAAAMAALAGCATPRPDNGRVAQAQAPTPLDQYPIRAVERPEELLLSVHPGGALSAAQDDALGRLANSWREAGASSRMVVQSPADGGPDARASAHAAADRLVSLGVAPAALTVTDYDAGPSAGAPVAVRFDRLTAEAPDCMHGWDNLVATKDNNVSTHFGCANARNFAVMLADPRDLNAPRPMTPADAGRRAFVLDKYRQGLVTSSAKDVQANGAISQRVQ